MFLHFRFAIHMRDVFMEFDNHANRRCGAGAFVQGMPPGFFIRFSRLFTRLQWGGVKGVASRRVRG